MKTHFTLYDICNIFAQQKVKNINNDIESIGKSMPLDGTFETFNSSVSGAMVIEIIPPNNMKIVKFNYIPKVEVLMLSAGKI